MHDKKKLHWWEWPPAIELETKNYNAISTILVLLIFTWFFFIFLFCYLISYCLYWYWYWFGVKRHIFNVLALCAVVYTAHIELFLFVSDDATVFRKHWTIRSQRNTFRVCVGECMILAWVLTKTKKKNNNLMHNANTSIQRKLLSQTATVEYDRII